MHKTVLAFDFGLKKIGVAIGNTLLREASPLVIIRSQTRQERFERIQTLLEEWKPDILVVGLPLTEEGGEQFASGHARRFANQLHGRFHLPVVLVDERGSSMQAQERLGRHGDEDDMAAAIILERYFDHYPNEVV
ncbi:Holliday junction resolvase RuvX [Pelistega sp. NLN82]|uniref:Putative pre-16S rRNA nuclease n=1 Tax=Pelistega ratti TaxID=2652177 RepID=A0A6L9Y4E8_9BURK|nr:Holliday junction resolvase RuvX [Pelistega ratti]NEN75299.1 Holliday junction resolvase RuvX [Pelistega ratti]